MKNLPDQTAESVGDRANGVRVSKTWDEPAIDAGDEPAFGFHRGVGRLIEKAPHLAVACRAAMTVVHARALVVAGAGADPGSEVLGWDHRTSATPRRYCSDLA